MRSLNNGTGTTAGEQITVINASTEALGGDYAAPMCGVSADASDAIYRFRPASDASVRIRVNRGRATTRWSRSTTAAVAGSRCSRAR